MENSKETIELCYGCQKACLEVLAFHNDKIGGRQLSSQHVKRLIACMEICKTTAQMLILKAPLLDKICELCAHLCEQCSTSCSASDEKVMKFCASMCRHCAGACYEESYNIKQAHYA